MTDAKTPRAVYPEDLSIRARRGDMRAQEQRALDHTLDAHPDLRLAHELGRDFDQELCVLPGDDALIFRASERALAKPRARRRAKRWGLALGLAAAISISTAAAMTLWRTREPSHPSRVAKVVRAPTPQSGAVRLPSPVKQDESPVEKSRPAAVPGAATITRRLPDSGPHARAADSAAPLESAASLFRAAGSARREGDAARARSLYTELAARFPGSHEARVSRISLGKLLLEAGHPGDAARAFTQYLAESDHVLDEEALVGRADALAQLGDRAEEIRAWQALLRGHPASVYRARAQQRLQALGAEKASAGDGS